MVVPATLHVFAPFIAPNLRKMANTSLLDQHLIVAWISQTKWPYKIRSLSLSTVYWFNQRDRKSHITSVALSTLGSASHGRPRSGIHPGWWLTYPSEKYESVGMMTFPTEWKKHVPVTTNQHHNFEAFQHQQIAVRFGALWRLTEWGVTEPSGWGEHIRHVHRTEDI